LDAQIIARFLGAKSNWPHSSPYSGFRAVCRDLLCRIRALAIDVDAETRIIYAMKLGSSSEINALAFTGGVD
jgi:hypothetical protein